MSFFADKEGAQAHIFRVIEILHSALPADLRQSARLPGVRPLTDGDWLSVDEAYPAQMAYRRALIAGKRDQVLWQSKEAADAIAELSDVVYAKLPFLGFSITSRQISCPDGIAIDREADGALANLGRTLQQDICVLQKKDTEHVLTAAILCFPASWTLSEKAGKPLSDIHAPVDTYTVDMAKRVQRMFDSVRSEQPLWRNNWLGYENPDLHQPRSESDPRVQAGPLNEAPYIRAERQCILRLPDTQALVFTIHTYVVKSE